MLWYISPDHDHYQKAALVNASDSKFFYPTEGSLPRAEWGAIPILFEMTDSGQTELPQITLLERMLVCTQAAWDVLAPLWEYDVRTYPVKYTDNSLGLRLLDVTNIIRCLEYSHSDYEITRTGRVESRRRYLYNEACLENEHLFKLPEGPRIFVSDPVRELVQEHSLGGLTLTLVSDNTLSPW